MTDEKPARAHDARADESRPEAGPGPENAPAKAKVRVATCSACGRKHADLTSRGRVVLVGADGLCGGCRWEEEHAREMLAGREDEP